MENSYQELVDILAVRVRAIPDDMIDDYLGLVGELIHSEDISEKVEISQTIMEALFPELIGEVREGNI